MNRMYCHCGAIVWLHFRLENDSYWPHFTSDRNKAELIDNCPGCGTSLNLMVTHFDCIDAPNAPAVAILDAVAILAGKTEHPFLLPAI
jgi:hypothetical protein